MRTAFEEDEDEITRHHSRQDEDDREVTLSSTTVLLIFFGLVLVCGLCFGLGYSLGHRSTPEGAISAPVQIQPQQAVSASGQPKPSAAAVTPAPISDAPSGGADTTTADETAPAKPAARQTNPDSDHETSRVTTTPAAVKAASTTTQPAPQLKPALAQTTPVTQPHPVASPASASNAAAATPSTPNPVPSGIMVQVAAVSNANDAQVLVGALRRHGFSATIHSQVSDSLLRVQVGPFATRADAAAMKQKLLAEGYNAIVK